MIVLKRCNHSSVIEKTYRASAELFEISAHLELETLALAWAVRNRHVVLNRDLSHDGPNGGFAKPFGLPDPTRGATHFHRHDEIPQWAATREPVALIGCYLFYNFRFCNCAPADD